MIAKVLQTLGFLHVDDPCIQPTEFLVTSTSQQCLAVCVLAKLVDSFCQFETFQLFEMLLVVDTTCDKDIGIEPTEFWNIAPQYGVSLPFTDMINGDVTGGDASCQIDRVVSQQIADEEYAL